MSVSFPEPANMLGVTNELHVLHGNVGGNHAKQVSAPVPNSARAFPIRARAFPIKQKIMHCGPGGGSIGGGSMSGGSMGGGSTGGSSDGLGVECMNDVFGPIAEPAAIDRSLRTR